MTRALHAVAGGKKRLTLLGAVLVALAAGLVAFAYYTSTGTGSGTASVGTLSAPGTPTRTGSGSTVNLSWTASTVTGGGTVSYHVERSTDPVTTWSDACGTTVGSPTTSTSCTDSPITAGTYRYRVTAIYASWTAMSGVSGAFVVTGGDVTPPTSVITFPGAGPYNATSWNAGCASTICGTAADVGSGVGIVEVTIRQGTGNYWNGVSFASGSPVWNLASGTTSWTYGFAASNFPADGSYTVQSRATDVATNVQSPLTSQTFTYDDTAPTNALSLVSQSPSGSALLSGSTVYYRGTGGGSGGSFAIRNAVADATSGPASSTTAALGSTTSGWSHSPSTVSAPSGGPYDSNTFTWAEGTSSAPTEVVTGADAAGNTTAAPTLTFVNDSGAPTGGALVVNGQPATGGGNAGYATTTGFVINSRTDYTDGGSGLASSVLTVQSFVLSSVGGILNGVCGAASAPFSSPTVVTGTTQPPGIVTATCYTYTLTGTDSLGNATSISTTVKVDTTAPNAPTLSISAATENTFISGTTVYINAQSGRSGSFAVSAIENDLQSGIQSVDFPLLTGFSSGGGLDTTSGYSSGTYNWSDAVGASGAQTVTGTNFAGLTNTSTFTVTPDTAAPTGGALTVNGTAATAGGSTSNSTSTTFLIDIRTDYTDGGSGLVSSTATVQSFVLSSSDGIAAGTCGAAAAPFASPTPFGSNVQPGGTFVTARCYVYTLTGTDNVGNVVSISTTVKVDTSAPSAPAISLSAATGNTFISGLTVFINAQAGRSGSFTASATTTDSESGITRVAFPGLTGFTAPGNAVFSDFASPFTTTYSWTGAVGSTGAQSVAAVSTIGGSSSSNFTVSPDTTVPSGSMASSGTSGSISLTATPSDAGSGVGSVAYYYCNTTCTGTPISAPANWTLIGTSTTPATWPVAWDSTAVTNGAFTLKAVFTDNVGNAFTTAGVSVTVANSYTFVVSTPGSQTAGTAFGGFTLQLQANGVNTGNFNGSAYTGSHTITWSGTAMSAAPDGTAATPASTSLTFNASGLATVSASAITAYRAAAGAVLTATGGTIVGTSGSFTIAAGAAVNLAWTNPTFSQGTISSPCLFTCTDTGLGNGGTFTASVSVTDTRGNIVSALGAGHTVTVSAPTNASGGSFQPGNVATVTLTISTTGPATSTATFTYKAGSGNWTDVVRAATAAGTVYTNATATLSK